MGQTTYPRNRPAYNAARSVEKDRVQELRADPCRDLPEPDRGGRGRKPHTVRDSVPAMAFTAYSTPSGRRSSSDLRGARGRGLPSRPVPGREAAVVTEDPAFAPIPGRPVARSALPLRAVETAFATDGSGFGSSRSEAWAGEKYGTPRRTAAWVKCHTACGVRTNVVTAVRVLDEDANDRPPFAPPVKGTAGGFAAAEASADEAYGGYENSEAVAGRGGGRSSRSR